jgi:hypothetical protein
MTTTAFLANVAPAEPVAKRQDNLQAPETAGRMTRPTCPNCGDHHSPAAFIRPDGTRSPVCYLCERYSTENRVGRARKYVTRVKTDREPAPATPALPGTRAGAVRLPPGYEELMTSSGRAALARIEARRREASHA